MSDKNVTVSELKTFIEAVEFAADVDGDWMPSERQWKRIRSMIDRLDDTPAAPQVMQLPQPSFQPPPMAMPMMPPQMAPGGMGSMMPAQQMNPHAPLANGSVGSTGMPVRTPDIDTSHGKGYQSAFA